MKLFNDLFVNLSILVTLLFAFNLLTRKRIGFISPGSNVFRRIQLGIHMGILGMILMEYTIHFNGTIVDLRQIAVGLAAVYGGLWPSMIASVLIGAGRLWIFGVSDASIMAASLILLIGLTCGLISRLKLSLVKKMLLMAVSDSVMTSVVFYMLIGDSAVLIKIYTAYWSVMLAGAIVALQFMEYLRISKEQFQKATEHAETDFLTGLYNVRKFDELLKDSLDKADHYREQVSVILIDIDHFKLINDTYGHQSGDESLMQIGEVLRNSSRSIDLIFRIGGEEFAVILPSCNKGQAAEVAERIRKSVEERRFALSNGEEIRISVSLGISTYGETTYNHNDMMKQADACLYLAKSLGRNKVVPAAERMEVYACE